MHEKRIALVGFILTTISLACEASYCSKAFGCSEGTNLGKVARYILYDVNPGEGFNLRRDVYMRMAMFMRGLAENSKEDWHLVLPPWTKMWHWRNEKSSSSYPWSNFFDVLSLKLYSPVIELEEFNKDYGETVDEVYILQHYPEFYTWTEGKEMDWSDRWNYTECRDHPYWKENNGTILFLKGKHHVKAKHVRCISFQGTSAFLVSIVSSTQARSIMFDRAEIATHIMYGDSNYWMCRRSMRFAKHLVDASYIFRASYLNSTDEQDGTVRPIDFRDERPHRSAKGGPYLGVHLRRQDFQQGRPKEVPSLSQTVIQIKEYLNKLSLSTVFVATDTTAEEYEYIKTLLREEGLTAVRFEAQNDEKQKFTEGGLAIIDQIIASHARYFVGTHESTFTYRIQEEREIMGFPADTTFNRFCPTSDKKDCTPPTKWLIKYPEDEPWQYSSRGSSNHFEPDEL